MAEMTELTHVNTTMFSLSDCHFCGTSAFSVKTQYLRRLLETQNAFIL